MKCQYYNKKESQAARIFSSLADLHATTSKEDLKTSVPTTSNQEVAPVLVTQEWLSPSETQESRAAKVMECVAGDEELAELIIRDMEMYEGIVGGYDFKTEQLHIDLVAAVNNFHKVEDDMDKTWLASSRFTGLFLPRLILTSWHPTSCIGPIQS